MSGNHARAGILRTPGASAAERPARLGLPPAVVVLVAGFVVALGIRLFTLSRPGFLSAANEYDDGVYLGAAIRLTQGSLPYKDFAFVQPPGIVLLMSPVALYARAAGTVAALAAARVLTACASAACVPLAGNLIRHRGPAVTALACGILAIYPADVATAHTLLLEPWMNLLCLAGANAAFSRGHLATRPARLAWAGVALGAAVAVKYWAAAPAAVLLAVLILTRPPAPAPATSTRQHARKIVIYLAGLAGAFVLAVAPVAAAAPGAFARATLLDQAARVGTYTPLTLRLAHLTGLIDLVSFAGKSLFAQGAVAWTAPADPGALAYLVALILATVLVAGYLAGRRALTQVEWFALATAVIAVAATLWYSAFFYHYPSFAAPWLAIAFAAACRAIAGWIAVRRGAPLPRAAVTAACAAAGLVLVAAAVFQLSQIAPLKLAGSEAIGHRIPAGACVLSDQTSLPVSVNRFTAGRGGCPDVVDALATTLVLGRGVSVQGGVSKNPAVVAAWQRMLSQSRYVWLSPTSARRIPWTPGLTIWFDKTFKPDSGYSSQIGRLYVRR